MGFAKALENDRGAALVIALLFLAIVALAGSTAVILTTTDMQIGANYKASTEAFHNADAGVNYALAKMEAGLKASPATFNMPTVIGDPTDPSDSNSVPLAAFTAPSGFGFSYQDPGLTMLATNLYTFTTDGTGTNNSTATITVTFKKESAITYAAFGDKKLDTKNGGTTLSYNSGSSDPTHNNPSGPSFQSTHEADVGSNDWLVTHNGAMIDGSGVLGEKPDGSATTNSIHGGTTFNDTYNTTPVNAGRIDPDPLGVNSGGEYDPTTYSGAGDNDNLTHADPLIAGNSISTNSSVKLTGKAGGSNFYLTSVELKNGAFLTIDTTLGEVNIFLTGPFDAKNGSSIVLTPNPLDTTKFSIFSNSTSKIDLKHSSTFAGLIYAPYAPIDVKNSAAAYGAIWGSNVDIKNSGTLYFDSALRDKFLSNKLTKTTWQHVQN